MAKTIRRVAGVRVSVRTMARMLERIGARHGMARPLPRPDWPKARKTRRVRKIMRVVESVPEDEVASPEHNRIERLWRDLHASVTRTHRCRTISKLMSRVRYWLRREAKRRSATPPDCKDLAPKRRFAA